MNKHILALIVSLTCAGTAAGGIIIYQIDGVVSGFGDTPPAQFTMHEPISMTITLNTDAMDSDTMPNAVQFGSDGYGGTPFSTFIVSLAPSSNYAGGTFIPSYAVLYGSYGVMPTFMPELHFDSGDSTDLFANFDMDASMPPIGSGEYPPLMFINMTFAGNILQEVDGGGSWADIFGNDLIGLQSGMVTIEPSWDQRVEIGITTITVVPEPAWSWIGLALGAGLLLLRRRLRA
jgi:hypothetical protein